jgi:hypothetical protein
METASGSSVRAVCRFGRGGRHHCSKQRRPLTSSGCSTSAPNHSTSRGSWERATRSIANLLRGRHSRLHTAGDPGVSRAPRRCCCAMRSVRRAGRFGTSPTRSSGTISDPSARVGAGCCGARASRGSRRGAQAPDPRLFRGSSDSATTRFSPRSRPRTSTAASAAEARRALARTPGVRRDRWRA